MTIKNIGTYISIFIALLYLSGAMYLYRIDTILEVNLFALLDVTDIVLLPFKTITSIYLIGMLLAIILLPRLKDKNKVTLFMERNSRKISKGYKYFLLFFVVIFFAFATFVVIVEGWSGVWTSIVILSWGIFAGLVVPIVVLPLIEMSKTNLLTEYQILAGKIIITFACVVIPLFISNRQGQKILKGYYQPYVIYFSDDSNIQTGQIIFETHNWLIVNNSKYDYLFKNEDDHLPGTKITIYDYVNKEKLIKYKKIKFEHDISLNDFYNMIKDEQKLLNE